LVSGEAIFVPYALANLNLTGADSAAGLLRTTTNGLASGNTQWEAILYGLCEVIERDCDWRWSQLPPAFYANNTGTIRLTERLGSTGEALLREVEVDATGARRDVVLFGILREEHARFMADYTPAGQ
jgi:ribosomal protein S12 methylthiotransferase accessory factor